MTLAPDIATLLELIESLDRPRLAEGTALQARDNLRAVTVALRTPDQIVEVGTVEDVTWTAATGERAARIYRPAEGAAPNLATVLFMHGGGWVIGDLDTHDNQVRRICEGTGSVVVSIDYRLAPEHPWPAAPDDALAALEWVVANIADLGGDPTRIAVAGDSAGGNLSAVLAQDARDRDIDLVAQLLLYPSTDKSEVGPYPSREANADGYLLTAEDLTWFRDAYVPPGTDPTEPRLSPLHGKLAGVAPAIVVTAEHDPLRDEGDAYARALAEAGVHVDHLEEPGLIHGFFDLFIFSPSARAAGDRAISALRSLLDA